MVYTLSVNYQKEKVTNIFRVNQYVKERFL